MFDLSKIKNANFSDIKDITNKLDSSKINSMIDKVGHLVECDEDCKNKNISDSLMENVLRLQREKATNPQELKDAIKKYITNVNGDNAYKKYLHNKFTRETDFIVKKNIDTLDTLYKELTDKIKMLNTNSKSNEFIDYLIKEKDEKKYSLKNTIDDEIHNTLTNERRALYKSDQSVFIQKIKTFMIVLYYILLVIYFIFEFILQKQYKEYKNWFLIVLYILIPIIIINFTFSISNLLINFYSSLKNNFKIDDI
tara:strand:- start:4890 stop:5648 length:759 start_codon:yes stop_codon:yes gene_type:complete